MEKVENGGLFLVNIEIFAVSFPFIPFYKTFSKLYEFPFVYVNTGRRAVVGQEFHPCPSEDDSCQFPPRKKRLGETRKTKFEIGERENALSFLGGKLTVCMCAYIPYLEH